MVKQTITPEERAKHIIHLAKNQEFKEIERLYPTLYTMNAAKYKSLYFRQKEPPKTIDHSPNLWIWGDSGQGKSAYVGWKFPNAYIKDMGSEFWCGFDENYHKEIYLPDMDHADLELMRIGTLKRMCDPGGFTGSAKFGALYTIRGRVIVTSQFLPWQLFPPGTQGTWQQKKALIRRFKIIHINDLLKEEGYKLRSKEILENLKRIDNADYSLCFEKLN